MVELVTTTVLQAQQAQQTQVAAVAAPEPLVIELALQVDLVL